MWEPSSAPSSAALLLLLPCAEWLPRLQDHVLAGRVQSQQEGGWASSSSGSVLRVKDKILISPPEDSFYVSLPLEANSKLPFGAVHRNKADREGCCWMGAQRRGRTSQSASLAQESEPRSPGWVCRQQLRWWWMGSKNLSQSHGTPGHLHQG